ncbi:hypothetical protein ASG77_07275 [Arthrobacter sp. Soil762]|nr:hypothetical protein ASG77_07275 [Arthrobacter sp. Soil762]
MTTYGAMVIGLEDSYRGEPLEAQLSGYGITYTRIPGVIVDDQPGGMADHVDQAAARVLQRRELTKGEVGCALAHRSTWAALLSSSAQFALVFEDDARLTREPLDQNVKCVLDSEHPVVVLLDSYADHTVVSRRARHVGDVYRTLVPAPGAWAYALNRAAADVLLERGEPISSVTDWPARVAHKVSFHVTYPPRARVDMNVASNLEASRTELENEAPEAPVLKFARLALTLSHLRLLRNTRIYGSYAAYASHELRRLTVNKLSRSLGSRLQSHDHRSPLTLP